MVARFLEKCFTFLFDVLAINIAYFAAFWLRYKSNLFPETFNPDVIFAAHMMPSVIVSVLWVILFFFTGLYRDWYKESRLDELFVVARTVFIGMFLLFLVTSAPQIIEFAQQGNPRILFTRTKFPVLLTYGSCMLFFATINRFTMHTLLAMLFTRGIAVSDVLIVGAGNDVLVAGVVGWSSFSSNDA